MHDLYWNIHPQAAADAAARLTQYYSYCATHGVEDGPAENAGRDGLPIRVMNGLAVVPLMGPMIRRAGPLARIFGIAGTDSTRLAIESALADEEVERILLRVDSPGGSVSGLDQLGDVINAAQKPIVVQVEGMSASAAYYVTSQADRVMVGRTDLVGSIGTRMMLYDFSKMFENEGIKAVPIDTGEFKSAGALGTEITEAQRADFQRIVDFYFADFVRAVSRGRNMTEGAVKDVADGRMFTPEEALESNLIDGIATLESTLNELRGQRQTRQTDSARARLRMYIGDSQADFYENMRKLGPKV